MAVNGWKLVELVEKDGNGWNGCKLLEIAGYGWKKLELFKIAKNWLEKAHIGWQ